jgi:Holliday junction resolvase RusA-like endonuclease
MISKFPEHKRIVVGALEIFIAKIDPVAKPRMTKRDCHRPAHKKYFAYKEQIKRWFQDSMVTVPEKGAHIIFRIPITKSWSKIRQERLIGKPHRGSKDGAKAMDKDNLEKALLDAIFPKSAGEDDSHIWDTRSTKVWHDHGEIIIIIDHAQPLRVGALLDYADNF